MGVKENSKSTSILSVGHCIIDTYSASINPIMPFIAVKLGITLSIAALILSISNLCSSIIQPFFGFLADSFKKRFFVFWGLIFAAIFLTMIGIAKTPVTLTLCLALGSLGVAFYHPQATSLIKEYSGNKTTQKISIYLMAGTAGFSIGPLVSSLVVDNFGLNKLIFLSIYGIITAFLILKFVPKTSQKNEFKSFDLKACIKNFFKTTKECFSIEKVQILFWIAAAKSLTVSMFCVFTPFLWKEMGYSPSKIGFLIFLFVSAGAIATISSPYFEKILGTKNIFYLSLITILPLTILFALTYKNYQFLSYIIFTTIGFLAMLSISINMVMSQNLVKEHKGFISGVVGGFSWGIVGLSLPITGFMAELIGIPYLLVLLSFIPTIIATSVKKL